MILYTLYSTYECKIVRAFEVDKEKNENLIYYFNTSLF